jgi:hypothetical protein
MKGIRWEKEKDLLEMNGAWWDNERDLVGKAKGPGGKRKGTWWKMEKGPGGKR